MGLFDSAVSIIDDDILAKVKEMLRSAQANDKIYLVTPYIKFDEKVRDAIRDAVANRAEVTLLVRTDADRNPDDTQFLANSHIRVFEHRFLHAKVYWCKDSCLVTSMNLHSFSDRSSSEIAVRFEGKKEIQQLREIIEKWLEKSREMPPTVLMGGHSAASQTVAPRATPTKSEGSTGFAKEKKGFCIRCADPKTYNTQSPLCNGCYREWTKYKNDQYVENVCHRCGRPAETTVAKPLCRPCFKEAA